MKRIHFAPVNLGYAEDNLLNEKTISFMEKRSQHEIGINILGNVAVDRMYITNPETLVLNESTNKSIWMEYIERISVHDTIPGIQIAAMPKELTPQRKWISNNFAAEYKRLTQLISTQKSNDIDTLFKSFETSIQMAKDLGFGYIEIHAAHGYFLSLLLDETISGQCKVSQTVEWLQRILKSSELSIRLSLTNGLDDSICFPKEILKYGFKFISLSNGYYTFNKRSIYPQNGMRNPAIFNFPFELRDQNFMVAGNIREREMQEYWQYSNIHFALGRPLIADPLYANKFISGDYSMIRNCRYLGQCHHFSNSTQGGVKCPMWEQ